MKIVSIVYELKLDDHASPELIQEEIDWFLHDHFLDQDQIKVIQETL